MFGHRRYRRMISLACTGDLTEPEEQKLERHLQTCALCRNYAVEERRFQHYLSANPLPPPGEEMLESARASARAALRHTTGHRSRTQFPDLFSLTSLLRPVPIAAGILLFLLGAVSTRYLLSPNGKDTAGPDLFATVDGARPANVQVLNSGDPGGQIEIALDAVRPIRVRGSYDDPNIQRFLAFALLNGDNAGVRLRAVSSISTAPPASLDREAKAALLLALRDDKNDAVRKESLRALLRYPPDREIRDALLSVLLHDKNPGLRVAAINGLEDIQARGFQLDAGTIQSFRDRFIHDDNLYVQAKARTIIGEQRP